MSSASLPVFGPSCPAGGTWYACATGAYFTGCCGRDPCQSTCAQGDLYPTSFIGSLHGTFPDASCGSNSKFYTCNGTSPAFMGCCNVGGCSSPSGCPKGNLAPSMLDSSYLLIAYGAMGAISSTSSLRASSTIVTSTIATTASGTGTASAGGATVTTEPAFTFAPKKDGPNIGAIAGGVVGGVVVLAAIIGLLVYYFCFAKRSRKGHEETLERRQSNLPGMTAAHEKPKGVYSPNAPPGYVSPNPNDYYSSHHAGQQHYQHQFIPEPQELPVDANSAGFVPQKVAHHQRNVSELSGDTAMRSELETPLGSPKGQSHFVSPVGSPQTQTQASASSPRSGSNWVAHQSWQSQSGPDHASGPAQGLGLHGVSENEATASGAR